MTEAFLKWEGPKSNDQISFTNNPYLACPHVACPFYVGFRATVLLKQGWATSSIGGPYVGRRSPSRARLLDGSSSISSTTTIVKAALIGSAKKSSTRPQMSCFPPKISVKQ